MQLSDDGRTHVQILDLVDDEAMIAEYEAFHASVWSEVTNGLHSIGIESMSIWRSGTRLCMVMRTAPDFDPLTSYQSYTADPKAREWDETMRNYQRQIPLRDRRDTPDAWWTPMSCIFDLGRDSA